jgi:hypothetical protein
MQDVMIQLLPFEERGYPRMIIWMLVLGAISGDDGHVRPWFILQLANFSKNIEGYNESSVKEWFTSLEATCRETMNCEDIQRDSVAQVAELLPLANSGDDLKSHHLRSATRACMAPCMRLRQKA